MLCQLKKMHNLKVENYLLFGTLLKTIAREPASHRALRNSSREIREEPIYRAVLAVKQQQHIVEHQKITANHKNTPLSYSNGMNTISEEDFAHILLRYTNVENTSVFLENVRYSIPEEKVSNSHFYFVTYVITL